MSASTLDRRQAVKSLLQNRGELLVVTGLGSPSYDAFAAGDHDGNFYLWGAMGGAAMVGLGILCGIGFTMSLFIGSLAFAEAPLLYTESVVGVLGASLVAAALGMAWLHLVLPRNTAR